MRAPPAAVAKPDLPAAWRRLGTVQPVNVGRSGAAVWHIHGSESFYAKADADVASLAGERRRTEWLRSAVGTELQVAEVLDWHEDASGAALLTRALRGEPLHEVAPPDAAAPDVRIAAAIQTMARIIRVLHGLDVAACPFLRDFVTLLPEVQELVRAEQVDAGDFDPERMGRTAESLLTELCARQPPFQELVVAHGDFCLPNLLLAEPPGVVDLGRLGVADRYQDLGIAARSIVYNWGDRWVAPFFAACGVCPDPARITFFQLLDEFF